jgi:hypothetical protein
VYKGTVEIKKGFKMVLLENIRCNMLIFRGIIWVRTFESDRQRFTKWLPG